MDIGCSRQRFGRTCRYARLSLSPPSPVPLQHCRAPLRRFAAGMGRGVEGLRQASFQTWWSAAVRQSQTIRAPANADIALSLPFKALLMPQLELRATVTGISGVSQAVGGLASIIPAQAHNLNAAVTATRRPGLAATARKRLRVDNARRAPTGSRQASGAAGLASASVAYPR